jgi:hypothetical protein
MFVCMRRFKGTMAAVVAAAAFAGCGSSDDFDSIPAAGGAGMAGAGAAGGKNQSDGSTAGSAGGGGTTGDAGDAAADADPEAGEDASADAGPDGAGATGAGGASDAGGDAPPTCADPLNEPNESENAATPIAGVDDCDASKKKQGILALGADRDWFVFTGTDNLLACSPNPKATVAKAGIRVCVFAQCSSGTTQVVCAKGTTETSPANRQGCCETAGTAEITLSCTGLGAKNADVYVRVDQPGHDACVDYELVYSY